jgi:hypothetical protein
MNDSVLHHSRSNLASNPRKGEAVIVAGPLYKWRDSLAIGNSGIVCRSSSLCGGEAAEASSARQHGLRTLYRPETTTSRRSAIDWLEPSGFRLSKRVKMGNTNRGAPFTREGLAIRGGKLLLLPGTDLPG